MKIEGVIHVEGVDLHVDVETADNAVDVYVTNVHPATLVVPPERLPLHCLAFSKVALRLLEEQKIITLADLVDHQGHLRPVKLSTAVKAEVEEVLAVLRKAALVFDWNDTATKDLTVVDPLLVAASLSRQPIPSTERSSNGNGILGSIAKVKLDKIKAKNRPGSRQRLFTHQQLRLLEDRGVMTVGDLKTLGEEDLLMMPRFDLAKIGEINQWLQSHGESSLTQSAG